MDREARSAEAKAFALEGNLCGSIVTPLYSSSNASRISTVKIRDSTFGDETRIPSFLGTYPFSRNGIEVELSLTLGVLEESGFHVKPRQQNEKFYYLHLIKHNFNTIDYSLIDKLLELQFLVHVIPGASGAC